MGRVKSDAELVAAIRNGRREDYAELVRRYERAVLATAMSVLGDRQDGEDAAQEAFLIAYLRVSDLRRPKAFGGWLLRIARNEAIRMARGRKNLKPLDRHCELAARRDGQLDERCAAVVAGVMRLSERQRVVVMLKYFDGLSVSQIAKATGHPVGTVTVRLARARKRLRKWMQEVRS